MAAPSNANRKDQQRLHLGRCNEVGCAGVNGHSSAMPSPKQSDHSLNGNGSSARSTDSAAPRISPDTPSGAPRERTSAEFAHDQTKKALLHLADQLSAKVEPQRAKDAAIKTFGDGDRELEARIEQALTKFLIMRGL